MSYTGLRARIPCGVGTFRRKDNDATMNYFDLVDAKNLRFRGDTFVKAPGLGFFDSNGISGTPNILEAFEYRPVSGTSRIISACSDGSVYRENAGDLDDSTLVTGLSFSGPITLLQAGQQTSSTNKQLLLFSDGVEPHSGSGDATSMSPLTNIPSDWSGSDQPKAAILHDFRVYAFGCPAFPHAIYVSTLNDHTDFSTGNPPIFTVAPGFSDEVVMAYSVLPELLYVWKYPFGIFRINTTQITDTIIPIQTARLDIGGSGPHGVTQVGQDVWFIANTGHIYSLVAAENSEDLIEANLTAQLDLEPWVEENVDLSKIRFARLIYDSENQEVHAVFTGKNGTLNDLRLVFDVSDPQRPRVSPDTDRGEIFQTGFRYIETSGNTNLYWGGSGGQIYKDNQISRNVGGTTSYSGTFRFPETDLSWVGESLSQRTKRFDWLDVLIKPTGSYDLTITIYIDGISRLTTSVSLGSTGGDFPFTLDTDRLGGGEVIRHKVPLGLRGQRIGIEITNNGLNENFSIAELLINFKPNDIPGSR